LIYSHERIAANHTTLTTGQIQEINAGMKPVGLSNVESVAYDVAMELLNHMRLLSQRIWERGAREGGGGGIGTFCGVLFSCGGIFEWV
jgi:hypothetical protein